MKSGVEKLTADIETLASAVGANGRIVQFRIWTCVCGQKNRVDVVKVIALAAQPRCGACKNTLRYEP